MARAASLRLVDKLLYGVASLGNSALFWSQSLWLVFFYSGAEGLGRAGAQATVRSRAAWRVARALGAARRPR